MSVLTPVVPEPIIYPESDGKPMAENTKQLEWIVVLYDNLKAMYHDRPEVFVAADLFWYPVEGQPNEVTAPDVLVVFDRPKGHRGSYKQWEEANVPVTIAFEILSPSNDGQEMSDKFAFYTEHGVEEYYIYNPENNRLTAYRRQRTALLRVPVPKSYVSQRLGIRFDLSGEEMVVYRPDGERFLTYEEVLAARNQVKRDLERANQQLDELRQQRDEALRKSTRLAELARKARLQQATPEELAEMERREKELLPPG